MLAIIVGGILGMAAAAIRQNSWLDYFAVGVTIGAQVLPNFVMAPILILIFTLWLGWLPGGGWNGGQIEPHHHAGDCAVDHRTWRRLPV